MKTSHTPRIGRNSERGAIAILIAAMWTTLFDGTSVAGWRMSTITNQPGNEDPGRMDVVDGALVRSASGGELVVLERHRPFPLPLGRQPLH